MGEGEEERKGIFLIWDLSGSDQGFTRSSLLIAGFAVYDTVVGETG
jgi:hypothetical protein